MNAQECLHILREIKDVSFATVDEKGFPQVRIIDVMLIENNKLYFCSARGKDFYKQLKINNHVALCAMTKNYQMIRYSGKAQRLDNQKYWIDRIFKENPSMNHVYPNESRYILEAFCIEKGQLEYFDLSQEPIEREYFSINHEVKRKGYMITDQCIQCGRCEKLCPQQCIHDYKIKPNHCLHCGLCYEECPVQAIKEDVYERNNKSIY